MADEALNCCTIFTKIILIIINVFYLLVGMLFAGTGVFILANSNDMESMVGGNINVGGAVVLATGVLVFVTGVLGIVGASANLWPLLGVYCFFVLTIIAIQVTAGVLAFVYKDDIKDKVATQLKMYISNYTNDDTSSMYNENRNEIVDDVQLAFKCCGLTGPRDWAYLNPKFFLTNGWPSSCECSTSDTSVCYRFGDFLGIRDKNVWKKGCKDSVTDYVHHEMIAIGAGAISVALFQLITIALSIGLCMCIMATQRRRRNVTRIQNLAYTPLESYPTSTINSQYKDEEGIVYQ